MVRLIFQPTYIIQVDMLTGVIGSHSCRGINTDSKGYVLCSCCKQDVVKWGLESLKLRIGSELHSQAGLGTRLSVSVVNRSTWELPVLSILTYSLSPTWACSLCSWGCPGYNGLTVIRHNHYVDTICNPPLLQTSKETSNCLIHSHQGCIHLEEGKQFHSQITHVPVPYH